MVPIPATQSTFTVLTDNTYTATREHQSSRGYALGVVFQIHVTGDINTFHLHRDRNRVQENVSQLKRLEEGINS
jgi:hypothetical protein